MSIYLSFCIAISQAQAIMALTHKSTGTRFAILCASQGKTRKIPLATPAMTTVGPLKLSTHPGTGSTALEITKILFQISVLITCHTNTAVNYYFDYRFQA